MIENNLVKRMTSKILKNRRLAFFDRNIMHPEREWMVGILVAILLLVVGILWSTKTYMQFRDISVTTEGEDINVVYRASMVKTALEDFSTRKKVYEDLKAQLVNKAPAPESITPEPVEEITPVVEEVPVAEVTPEEENIGSTEGIIFE